MQLSYQLKGKGERVLWPVENWVIYEQSHTDASPFIHFKKANHILETACVCAALRG